MATNQGNKQQGNGTSNRGFASMDPQRQREIASEGGKAAHRKGTAHEFTSEEARKAGSMSHGNRQSAQSSSGSKQSGNQQSARSSSQQSSQGGNKQSAQGGNRGSKSGNR